MKPDPVETFCRALWKRDGDTIAKLLRRVDPNAKDRWGNTPVLMAAQFGELKVMTVLLDRGGDIEQGRTQLTPLALAARRNASDIVDFLRQRGAAVSLLASIILGDRDRLARELTLDPSCARHTDEGGTPFLHHAAESLHVGMVTLLLDGGASVADADSNGETALHRAADLRPAATGEPTPMPAIGTT
ncbi:MAG: ankyrin repeat domain-containing protein [Planctomycetota bacterium]|nr:ankyrin repeat domain-containing protein [Planctomycetota bacterium]